METGSQWMELSPIQTGYMRNMERPTSRGDIQRLLGVVNYQGKFFTDLSTKTAPLRSLLDCKNTWVWTPQHERSWVELKNLLSAAPVLAFYDPLRQTKISSDASQSGLRALIQQFHAESWRTVAYASRAMTDADKRYAQNEKELSAITFACERFH